MAFLLRFAWKRVWAEIGRVEIRKKPACGAAAPWVSAMGPGRDRSPLPTARPSVRDFENAARRAVAAAEQVAYEHGLRLDGSAEHAFDIATEETAAGLAAGRTQRAVLDQQLAVAPVHAGQLAHRRHGD